MTQKAKADSDKEFDAAMSVWFKHRYGDGEKLLGKFAAKYPNSRWRAEAEIHQGCYYTYLGATDKAKPLFERLASEFADTNISTKAQLRLANIAEREARTNDAISQYTRILRMNPTWDQFKYANYHARKLAMTGGALQARVNCGPVALAACLNALGRKSEAARARGVRPTTDGLSLAQLQALCVKYGVPVKSSTIALDQLQKAKLPVLAYVEPKHFIAVLAIRDGKAQVEDSIRGKYEATLDELGKVWSGKVLTFAPSRDMKPLTRIALLQTVGGCCGQIDEDECGGDCCPCQQDSRGPATGTSYSGGGGCGTGICPASAGRPTWQVNVDNLNMLVTDTPVFYNPGKGPSVAFTLRYSNENSNTGIFGRGWRCPYDMKVFFLPSGYPNYPTLQVHRDSGRIETYEWNDYDNVYQPRSSSANYGYRDAIELTNGTVVLSLRGGGKYYFMPEGGPAEGRIHIIEDQAGNQVTCDYNSSTGCLTTVTDASGGITDIITEGTGINERVTHIRIPRYVNGSWVRWNNDTADREAVLAYTDGNLTSITDMLGEESTLSYNAMLFYTDQASSQGATDQAITTTSPANGESVPLSGNTDPFFSSGKIRINNSEEITYAGKTTKAFTGITRGANPAAANAGSTVVQVVPGTTLSSAITETSQSLDVGSTASFPAKGWIAVVGASGAETMYYTGKTSSSFTGITRGGPTYAAATGSSVYLCSQSPYLSEIVTPSMKTKFTYKWAGNSTTGQFVSLYGIYECGRTESYPQQPTTTYDWDGIHYQTTETRYGDRTKIYDFSAGSADAAHNIADELGNTIVTYEYNGYRDRTSITDASLHATQYDYGSDGKHNLYSIRRNEANPGDYRQAFTYNDDHSIHTEKDAYGTTVKTYTYNTAGQITRIDMPLSIYVTNTYDTLGRMTSSTDGRGKTTTYNYETTSDPRGFLTSVEDPEGKTTYYHYDQYGRKDQVTDPSGNVTRYEYDGLDRVTKTIFGTGTNDPYTETKYTCCHKVYDQDENGRRTYYVYDAKVRPYKTIVSAASTTLATGITPALPADTGNLSVADASGLSVNGGDVVVLDEIIHYAGITGNTLTGITRGYYNTRKVEVDSGFPVGRVDSVQATYGYHSQYPDWMISLADALGHTTYYEYYLNGKLKTIRYPDDTGERYTYDNSNSGLNMITKEYGTFSGTYPSQTFTANDAFTVHYEYDDNNSLTSTYH